MGIGPTDGIALGLEYEISWTRTPSLPSIDDLKMTHAHGHWHGRIQRGANAHEVGIAFLVVWLKGAAGQESPVC